MERLKKILLTVLSVAIGLGWPGQVYAYTSKQKTTVPSVGGGVTALQALSVTIVQQGTGGAVSVLDFPITTADDLRDSGEALKVAIDTNLAANRLLIYTDNTASSANPKCALLPAELDTARSCSGLVGVSDQKTTVPLVWAVGISGVTVDPLGRQNVLKASSTAVDYSFTPTATGVGATNGVLVTDLSQRATFTAALTNLSTTDKQQMDTLAMRFCSPTNNPTGTVSNPDQTDETKAYYPQFFGAPNVDKDLCNNGAGAVTIGGIGPIPTCSGTAINVDCLKGLDPAGTGNLVYLSKVPFAEELSKNIAVVAFNCTRLECLVPNLTTTAVNDFYAVQVATAGTMALYLPMAADFRGSTGQDYATNTITLELVTQ